jgi:SAM-dependent methyltransferase
MTTKDHYSQYVSDKKLIDTYNDYQQKYKVEPRESDKVSISLAKSVAAGRANISILDIACSTGNFLRHLRAHFPSAHLTGADLAVGFIEQCKKDPELAGIEFKVADMLKLPEIGHFDIISANAVTYLFDWPDYRSALKSIADALSPGGAYIGFEFVNPFTVQDLTIVETNDWNPDGLTLRIRPMKKVEQAMKESGFESVEFKPFTLPIDLPHPGHDADVVTYTRRDEHGERLAFRGVLYQPWCHFVARKAQ